MSTQPPKVTVGLLFGGCSAEHEVSRASAANVLRALDPAKYDVVLIGLAKDGRWLMCDAGNGAGTGTAALAIPEDGAALALVPGGKGRLFRLADGGGAPPQIYALVPVLAVATEGVRACTSRVARDDV